MGVWAGLGVADQVRGWVVDRTGFCGVLATWVRGWRLQPPGSWAPSLHVQLRCYFMFIHHGGEVWSKNSGLCV